MPDSCPPIFLATAIDAVIRAGGVQLAHFGRDFRIDKKGAIDLVTDIDLAIERSFRSMIAERFPDHTVLGEEFEEAGQRDATSRYCWVFDPIDGTTNYAHGLPVFCSSLSLEVDGEPVVAAVYDPTRGELFAAERGHGAWLNGAPLAISRAATLIDSLLCTGFPYSVHKDPTELLRVFTAFIRRARAVRRLGSAAIDLCYVAAGRLDGFWERQLHPWDVSAGALIVQEAGGRVTSMSGSRFRSRGNSVLASNGLIHDAMLETIATVSPINTEGDTDI